MALDDDTERAKEKKAAFAAWLEKSAAKQRKYIPKSEERDREIAALYKAGRPAVEIGEMFGLSRGSINLICKKIVSDRKEIDAQIGLLQRAFNPVSDEAKIEFLRRFAKENPDLLQAALTGV